MFNLHLIENQPHWRVALVARFAQLIGVMVHVEGFPFGSKRNYRQGATASGGVEGPPTPEAEAYRAQADENEQLARNGPDGLMKAKACVALINSAALLRSL